jgi:DNA polymerase-1
MLKLFKDIEFPLIPVIADLEAHGYLIDCGFFGDLRQKISEIQNKLLPEMRDLAGRDLNPNSAPDLGRCFYQELGLPVLKKTSNGQPSTDQKALGLLVEKHPLVPKVLEWKKLSKILSTYCGFQDLVGSDFRLRPSYSQVGTVTGRLTASYSIQTIPKRDNFGIRRGFVAPEGFTIVAGDFDQQEMFVLASVSGDDNLLQAINDGQDLHGLAAKLVFGLDCEPNEVKNLHEGLRNQVKAIQFGIIYGSGPESIGQTLGIGASEAASLIDAYFSKFPKIQEFIDVCHLAVNKRLEIRDIFGRRRVFKKPKSKADTTAMLREAQNFPIQAAGASITKLAMIKTFHHIKANHPDIGMILSLHDEIQFEVPFWENMGRFETRFYWRFKQ